MTSTRLWRTLVRLESINKDTVSVVLPAFMSEYEIEISKTEIPANILQIMQECVCPARFNAMANIGADDPDEIVIEGWEPLDSVCLWLDDERNPVNFQTNWKGFDVFGLKGYYPVIWVKTVERAMEYISKGVVKEISFDHDLGTRKNGYDLAKWIEAKAANNEIVRLHWQVHSQNPVGRKNIEQTMQSCDRMWKEKGV